MHKEWYYTWERHEYIGIEPYCQHIRQYFSGVRTVPVCFGPSMNAERVYFTYSNEMMRLFLTDLDRIERPHLCALRYGFRGFSRGGKNGIFYQRASDRRLPRATDRALGLSRWEIKQDLLVDASGFDALKKIKIVYHNSAGERVVGVMNEAESRAIFVAFGRYR